MSENSGRSLRTLVMVPGDQLDRSSSAFDGFDPKRDAVLMAEAPAEATYVWSHKARIALFLSAMRHFRDRLRDEGITVHYRSLDEPDTADSLGACLREAIRAHEPSRVVLVKPGAWRVQRELEKACKRMDVECEVRPDWHFLCSLEQFREHAEGRKELRQEYFYREMRRRHEVLMEDGGPAGGEWNYDTQNRESFGKQGPPDFPRPRLFEPDGTTREVLQAVDRTFPDHPGGLDHFDWPVTRDDALEALEDFVTGRLRTFGTFQDAMWTDRPFLSHSRLSAALNLKLLRPGEVIRRAEHAWREGEAPLKAVESFIRQILGWREFVRGIYWTHMPDYLERNALNARLELPDFYWTGETDMACLRQCIGQTLRHAYAHHIQRLMVTGLFCLLLGVRPHEVHRWYLAVYADAVEWVELPNTLGMSQFADGGVMATKPYAASGKYINRMSNYCGECRFDPDERTGADACPFTTLYWDFLLRNRERLSDNPRMALQLRNLDRLEPDQLNSIRHRAGNVREVCQ